MWGATRCNVCVRRVNAVSIHAPRVGRDALLFAPAVADIGFNPRAPCGARPPLQILERIEIVVSIHAPRVGRDLAARSPRFATSVSIHAPRVGRDAPSHVRHTCFACFNPRAPCGARPYRAGSRRIHRVFQSTRPVWGATRDTLDVEAVALVSIHAPRVGRDPHGRTCSDRPHCFNPRAPCGARPSHSSIRGTALCFNPRAPCGARPIGQRTVPRAELFQSTRPVWGATPSQDFGFYVVGVSIHAPRVGRDLRRPSPAALAVCFNPRAPCGARLRRVQRARTA